MSRYSSVATVTLRRAEQLKNRGSVPGSANRFYIPLSVTNEMQRYTIIFIAVSALHVSGGFSAHHQELKLYIQHLVYVKLACCYR